MPLTKFFAQSRQPISVESGGVVMLEPVQLDGEEVEIQQGNGADESLGHLMMTIPNRPSNVVATGAASIPGLLLTTSLRASIR